MIDKNDSGYIGISEIKEHYYDSVLQNRTTMKHIFGVGKAKVSVILKSIYTLH